MIQVVKASIRNESGEFLVLLRSPNEEFFPDMWDFPGGKVEEGEVPEEAVRREVSEETTLDVDMAEEMSRYELIEKDTALEFIVFDVAIASEDVVIHLEEYSEFKWASMTEILESEHTPFLDLYFSEFPDI